MEYLIAAIFVGLSFFAIYKIKMYGARGISKHWFAGGFLLKLLAAVAMICFYSQGDRNKADIFRFYDDAQVISEAAFTAPGDYLKMFTGIDGENPELDEYYQKTNNWDSNEGSQIFSNNRFIIRYISFLSLLTFGSYGGVLVLTIFFAFTGLFWVFRFFYSRLPDRKWLIFVVVFFTPSLVFWTSGLLKESLLIGFLGLSLNCGGFALKGRQPIARLIMFAIALVFIFQLRAITFSLWILVILPFVWNHFKPKQRVFVSYFIFIFIAFSFASESNKILSKGVFEIVVQKKMAFETLANESNAGSLLSTTKLEPTTISILKNTPEAITNVLIRPFPWEAGSFTLWLAFFENFILVIGIFLIIILYKKKKVKYNLLGFSLIFAILYFVIIGLSVPVMGAISRYRVIPLLFFELGLLQIIDVKHISSVFKKSRQNI